MSVIAPTDRCAGHSVSIGRLPLSSAQMELWVAQLMTPDRSFSIGAYADVEGFVDASLLNDMVAQVIAANPALRSRVEVIDEDVGIVGLPVPSCPLLTLEVASRDEAISWISHDMSTARSPEAADLSRFVLLRWAPNRYVWYQCYHHLFIDGRSVALVARDIGARYAAHRSDAGNTSHEDPIRADAVVTDSLSFAPPRSSDASFWRDYLAGSFDASTLQRRYWPSTDTLDRAAYERRWDGKERLKLVASRHGVPESSVWMAIVVSILRSLVDCDDLQLSLPVAGVSRQARSVVGMASNIVPLRVQVAPAIGIVALAQQLAQGMRRIVRRQSYRGEAIRREHGLGSGWFGPAINVMDFDCGPAFPGCQFVWHTPTIGPFDDLSIAVVDYGDGMSSQILLSDDTGGHTQSQLAAYADAMVAVAERLLHDDDPTVADLPDIWCPSVNAVLATTPYALRRRKGDGGFLQWTTRADVHAMFQAVVLDEHADNTFPWPRIAFGESAISVTRVVSLNERAWHPPGHLLAVTDEGWTVATGDGDILLSGFLGEDLQPEHPSAASHRFGLHPGDRLPEGVAATPDTSCFALASIHDAEPFWAARLARYRSQRIPGLAMDEAGSTQHVTAWCDLPECARNRNGYGVDVFVAALAAYISRATGETAIQMGWRVESHASTGDLVASLAKCVPLEIEVDYSSTLDELAQLAAAERACVTGHASYFIELPVRHPLCRANAALRRAQPWQVGICIALADEQPLANLITGRELTLQICLASMCYRWIIAGDHADRASVHFVTEGVERLLHEGLEQAHVAVPVAQLPLLGVRESRYVIEHLNATTAVYPEGRCLHELFELQVVRVPQAHALMHRGQPWTYAQLDHEADRLAQVLVSEGVGRASLVGLCVDRTPWLIVGMLAILKAGGAYVPLDPAYPTGRLQWVCEDAAPRWLVCDATGRAALGDAALTQRCVLDVATAGTRATAARAVRPVDGGARDVAYVIYTSGSTGTPKGVLIEHAQATNLVYWAMDAFDAHERARVAFCTSVQFDLSVFECFVPLCSGGTVYLLDDALALPSVAHDVTLINTVPSAIGALLDGALPATTTATVNLAGEPLRSSLVERLFAHTAVSRICNLYGPSETTTYSTWTAMHRDEPREETIGRPLANTQIYLLDAHAQPVPLGSPGEIYIGGRGVARGYLGRAELTASRFVRDPFTSAADARMYRTGDLARYLPDGRLVYLGRNDHQVKIRGFRIELGEIEARLIAHDAVREAIVTVAPGGEDTQPRLLAYLIGTAVDAGTLREHLATGLPEYMLPAAYIWLDAWPLTPNGKLDRQALPQPDEAAYARHTYEEPQGDIEIALAQWWSELLGVAKVGRRDDFFALGGHSLVAMRLLSRLRQRFAIDLPLATVFERPVLAALAAALTATGTHAASTAIAPRAPDTAPSLSFAQQRLWFLSRMGAAAGSYHLPLVLRLRGALSPMALRAALGALLVRHEALRTVFIDHDGEPQARLLGTDIALPWTVVDLRTEPATLSTHVQTAIGEAFDLAVGPLIRAHLYRTGDDEHVLLLTQHHIVSDGWSMDILLRELVACYEAAVSGGEAALAPLPIQYADYAAWQRAWLTEQRLATQAAFWREALVDVPVRLELPTDRPRPPQQGFAGAHVPVHLDAALTRSLWQLGQRHGATLYMTILAAWTVVLSRLSGQDDLVVGTPTANRGRPETEGLIGFFVNTLALRLRPDEAGTVAGLLGHVRQVTLAAQDHQDLPFEQVVEIAQPPRRLDHTPLFQVMFAWQPSSWTITDMTGIEVEAMPTGNGTCRFDLELILQEDGSEVRGILNHATSLYDVSTMQRHVDYLMTVLRAMTVDGASLSSIDMLSEAERAQQTAWNATEAPYPSDTGIHALIEAQVRRTPEAIAVRQGDDTLTYAELDRKANRLACRLLEHGLQHGEVVAVCLARTLDLVVAYLGILKAGGAYLPLDPSHPASRLSQTLDDAMVRVVLVDPAGLAAFAETSLHGRLALNVGQDNGDASITFTPRNIDARDLAYVIYTSGSTGRPKGVMIEHRSLVALTAWHCQAFDLRPGMFASAMAGLAFDASTWEIWPTLVSGGCLLFPPAASLGDLQAMLRWWIGSPTQIGFLTTSLATTVLAEGDYPPQLETLLIGGDRYTDSSASLPRGLRLVNNYGPTETTVVATSGDIDTATGRSTIGRAIANTRIHILDKHGHSVPCGTVGEMYIGGVGVARGYLGNAELTDERFIHDRFSANPGERLYRTGDLARFLPDGSLAFHGRNDDQVKIRGYRVEPGEIEACLKSHPWVQDAVVVTRSDAVGTLVLVAFVVGTSGHDVLVDELARHARSHLPSYMIPAAILLLDGLPMTANGKVDRRALPSTELTLSSMPEGDVPEPGLELLVATAWAGLLDGVKIARQTDFFESGGHSLLALRFVGMLGRELGVHIPMSALFAHPRLIDFAAALAPLLAPDQRHEHASTVIERRTDSLPLASFAQQAMWLTSQTEHGHAASHIVAVLRFSGDLNTQALRATLNTIYARHDALRTTFVFRAGALVAKVLPAGEDFPLAEIDLAANGYDEAGLAAVLARESGRRFDLASGPLVRACLVRTSDHEHVFQLALHHIVCDGGSMDILVRDIEQLYLANVTGQIASLDQPLLRYVDFAAWESEQWSTGHLATQARYWTFLLRDAPPTIALPTDRAPLAVRTHPARQSAVCIPQACVERLNNVARRHGTTLFATVLAAWWAVLARLSGQSDIVIGTPSSQRRRPEIANVVGLLINTLPLRIVADEDATLAEVVEQAARATRDALDHQDVPYDKVVEMLRSEGRDAQASLFQVMISWQGAMRVPPLLPGLAVEIVDTPETFLRYDLELDLREEGGAVVGALGYDAELFDEARIARHLGYFQRMLAALAGDDQARYAQVDILDVAERESLLGEAIGGGLSSNLPSGIHRVVEDQALRDGSAVAIMHGDVHLTYLELDARANRFARYLSGLAPIHGRPVAICMERCADMIVAVLAVLKAGGFYVPIDSNYPAQRIADIIDDARPDIVVTDARHRAQLSTVVPMVAMDGMPRPWDACPATPLDERTTSPHDLAYVIYTSGSTGIPKGVMVEHASVVRQIETVRRTYELGSADRYLQFSSLAFDVSVEEIFGALSSGACLVLRTDESISSPQAFDAFCNTHAITIASLPTAFWSGMVSHWASPGRGLPSNLSRIVIGGEAVSAPALKAWFAIGHHLPRVFNAYGPTETTINATIRRVDASGAWHSIGKVVDHGRLYLLDRHRSLVPMGTVGEIHVGGDILARGYHGRPALTAERFVADPFRATGDARMYRTGDLARRLPDGEIEYLGRNDNQVQIRGHRVELGEIEAVLGDCAWVDQVMVDVVAHNDQSERIAPRIVAYVEASSTGHALSEPLPAILKSYLATRLPSYMLPSVFVAVATWPLTVNGKIDKARLPSIEEADVGSAPFEEPQGVVEQAIAAIWRDLLGLSVVGRHAGFFEIGGHSLLAVQMLGRVCDRFGCSIAMSRLFAAPTVALLAEEVNFAAMSNEEASVDEASELGLRLTSAQQRLWLLEAGADVGSSYHMPVACRLHGALDIHAFRKSLDRLYARHDVLRTVITEQDGLPVVSLLDASMGCPLAISHVTRANTEAIAELCLEEYGRPFDLSCEPPLRAALIGLPDGDHLFLLTLHHLVADATTLHIVMSELSALYAAAPEGGSDPLPPVVATSFDHAMWEARWSRSSARRVAVDYWKGVLVGSPPALDLPLDRPRMARREHEAAFVPIVLDKTLTSGLRELARRSGATVFMAMLGAWSVVLSRLASQSDIVIGTPVSSRTRAMWEDTVGCFVNTLPLRINLHDAPTPQTLIERVRDTTLAAFDHAQLPFEAILAASGAVRHAEISPLFQVMFVWEQNADALPELAGLTVERIDVDYASSKFDLELVLSDRGDTIEGGLNFATALFDRSTITQHVGYLLTVLSEMVRDASQPLGTLRLLAADEYHELIEHLNATTAVYPEGRCLHELFELQVARVPQAHALMHRGQPWTYAQLDHEADRLAQVLVSEGVGRASLVGLCVDRTPWLIVGMLAILKAGGAYVPLDPAYPTGRLQWVCEDAAPRWLVCDATGRAALGDAALTQRCVLDVATAGTRATAARAVRPVDGGARDVAYVIYTSGSTGTPKGVLIEHAQATNLVYWAMDAFDAHERARVAFCTSVQFDLSVFECFVPLCSGGTVYLLDDALALPSVAHDVTLINTVPSAIGALLDGALPATTTATVNLAGEPLRSSLVERLFAHTAVSRICNLYGPSETTTYSTWTAMHRDEPREETIGRPLANTQIYLLDAHAQPVPLGSPGEIYIGGRGVARGYLGRAELTASRFVRDPFTSAADARMYRTGDLARYLPDGRLVYLGRNDHQVKIRGFRIELGEIEARLIAHDAVREAIVTVAPGGEDTQPRLLAYLIGTAVDAGTLREHLATGLPEYMLPAAYIWLDAWPLTPNGKLDRQALPQPDEAAYARHTYEEPQGDIEIALAQWWSELLGVAKVGRRDDFFALGGHSLVAMRLLSRLRQRFAIDLPLATVFERPVLAALAAALTATGTHAASTAIAPRAPDTAPSLSFAQQRLWFLSRMGAAAGSYHLPLVLRLRGALSPMALRAALGALLVRHEALRTVFIDHDGEPQARLLGTDIALPWTVVDLRTEPATLSTHVQTAIGEAFDLAVGPLIRAHLYRTGDDEHVLLLTQHHIVSDGWSMDILLRELVACYEAAVSGGEAALAPLPIQYADYAAWQRAWLTEQRLATQAAFWREALVDVPVRLELPTDRPRPPQQGFAGAHVPVHLDAALTRSLWQLGQRHGATLYMTILAAWTVVLSRLSGQDDLVVGTPTANRGRPETEGLIGFFVNTLALRLRPDEAGTVAGLLGHVRQVTLAAQDHQDLPFEQVVEIAQPPRRLDHTPLFQVMFAWRNVAAFAGRLGDVDVDVPSMTYTTARFDLELDVMDDGEAISGTLVYATGLFDASTMQRHVDYLMTVLRAMTVDGASLSSIDILSAAERAQQAAWNATEAAYPTDVSIHALIEAQVQRTPEAIAVRHEDGNLTYTELNRRANRLAHRLVAHGVGPDRIVAVCAERGVPMVISLLAILKAGGAYLPLDPSLPTERLRQVLDDASPAWMLVDGVGETALAELGSTAHRVHLDQAPWTDGPTHDPQIAGASAGQLAYVIYTSGSTGRPKGVMNEHGALVNRLTWMQSAYGLDHTDIVIQKTPFSFDVSVWEFFWPLLAGASLAVPPPELHKDAPRLAAWMRQWQVTTAHFVPSMLASFVQVDDVAACTSLRRLILSGEALPAAHVLACRQRLPAVALHNLYGPTEAAIDVTAWTCPPDYTGGTVPIGRPIANTAIHLLDRYGRHVPRGTVGELHIGGVGVARGYLNRDGLTAERFVSDPFRAGGRLYKTGDLARYAPDGQIEYLGRNDDQVKIRGFRIELGDIEACLATCASIRDVAVVARDTPGSDVRLIAYLVVEAGQGEVAQWRAHAAAHLPEYMVPAAFVQLAALPLTGNGKLDRKALPAPDDEAFARRAYEPPQGDTESAIAAVWEELLGVTRVGRRDHFFELGGHSLLAVRMLARISTDFGLDIELSTLFNHPDLDAFAREVLLASLAQQFDAADLEELIASEGQIP